MPVLPRQNEVSTASEAERTLNNCNWISERDNVVERQEEGKIKTRSSMGKSTNVEEM